ncbi:phosphate ABC transporter substrate-binding protein [Elusimicrobiota bacterium]
MFLLVLFFASCSRGHDVSSGVAMQIKGSDTIVNLVQVWAEEYVRANQSCNVGVTGGGSGTGFAALLNHTCDIAMASREAEDREIELAKEKNIEYKEFIVGLDGLAVLVHKDNPVNHLTMSQLRDIFMARVTNWKELGGEDRKIVILSRESNSGTHMFFKEHVLRHNDKKSKDEFSPSSLLMPSSQAIFDEIYQNPNALGYVGMGFINDKVKALSISNWGSNVFIYPSLENVKSGMYPISRPLYLYTDGEPKNMVKDFIEFTLSQRGQQIVAETDFVPIRK